MTLAQQFITIGLCAIATMLTRFVPFLLFSGKKTPRFVQYLGQALPGAIFGMLVVYCLKDVSFVNAPFGVPELIGCTVVTLLHIWKRNTLLSIGGGTVFYMLLVQFLF